MIEFAVPKFSLLNLSILNFRVPRVEGVTSVLTELNFLSNYLLRSYRCHGFWNQVQIEYVKGITTSI